MPNRTRKIAFFNLLFMKYLIKLADWTSGREAFVECPANMPIEELSVKIKVALHLPYLDHEVHWFQMLGKVYVPNENVIILLREDPFDGWAIPEPQVLSTLIQYRANYPHDRDVRDSKRYTLKQVFTTKGSVITYHQDVEYYNDYKYRDNPDVHCTLIDRIP